MDPVKKVQKPVLKSFTIQKISEMLEISRETARKMAHKGLFGQTLIVGAGETRKHLRVTHEGFRRYCAQSGIEYSETWFKQERLWQ